MAKITITIPTSKEEKTLKGYLKLYPNGEMKPNPAFISEEETPEIAEEIAKYTDSQWVNEQVKRIFIRDVHRGLNMINDEETSLTKDDSIVE